MEAELVAPGDDALQLAQLISLCHREVLQLRVDEDGTRFYSLNDDLVTFGVRASTGDAVSLRNLAIAGDISLWLCLPADPRKK